MVGPIGPARTRVGGPVAQEPSSIRLRPMSWNDLAMVHALGADLFSADAWPLGEFVAEFMRIAQGRRSYTVAVDSSGTLVGVAGVRTESAQAVLQTLAVSREAWGRGIGRRLLARTVADAEARGCREVVLHVSADNPRARDLYRKFGFQTVTVQPAYYRSGCDALAMRLPLRVTQPSLPAGSAPGPRVPAALRGSGQSPTRPSGLPVGTARRNG
ncbi:GNAT family N-acetyltransferase [Streptomyces vinaceus]|uniref:GNAT family N-acetyltransferase n=1 Tax=Streptomyces vinaceus TaxID=1960 RepID=UPI0037FA30AE